MTKWHSDKPVTPVAPVRGLSRVSTVAMFITPPVAQTALSTARAFYARKLRAWAKTHGERKTED